MDSGNARTSPVRVLHVLGGMNRGGVETWLMHVLRHIDRNRFRMDFLVHTVNPSPTTMKSTPLARRSSHA